MKKHLTKNHNILRNKDIAVSLVRPNRNAVAFIQNAKRLVGTSGFVILRTNTISPYYLYAFCKTKFFITKLMRENTATMYPAVSDTDVLNMKIPIFPLSFQQQIESKVKDAHTKREQSQSLYRQAEDLLLETIGLKGFEPSRENKSVKSFKESFLATGRLDAEYYQPKYEEIIAKVKRQKYDLLRNVVSIKKSIEPGSDVYSDEGLPFLRVADYNKFGISNPEKNSTIAFVKIMRR